MTTATNPIEPQLSEQTHPADCYRLEEWGGDYFTVTPDGHVAVRAGAQRHEVIDLYDVMEGLQERGLNAPILLRFSDILAHRMRHLHDAFQRAIKENGYKGSYACVFPIKVNQQRQVVEDIYRLGAAMGFGLEVGSKPELLAVMAISHDGGDRPIICNGFKDDEYIEAVVLASKLGRSIIPVIENLSELRLLIKHARRYNMQPRLGVRVKLASQGAGRWRDSAGAKAKFGLFVSEVLTLVNELKAAEMLDGLELVHCHVGSQVQEMRTVKETINELAHVYVELRRLGANIGFVDVGGGLGVDYDGTQSSSDCSINYSLNEYASDIVYRIGAVCDRANEPHPTILSESGRAIVAHHAVLVINTVGANVLTQTPADLDMRADIAAATDLEQPVADLITALDSMNADNAVESYHDATQARDGAINLFNLGYLSLERRAVAERLFWTICSRAAEFIRVSEGHEELLADLDAMLCDVYFCNFSLFQSLPDHWAIDQLFPIMPIHRLNEQPDRRAILADMTCDSDGKITSFIANGEPARALQVHALRDDEPYYLGVFLVGAYQETLGDLHNLFGDTHVVHIYFDRDEQRWAIEETIRGDTARDVLGYVQFDASRLMRAMSQDCERAVRRGTLTVSESRTLLDFYESSMNGYTYLEPE